MATAVELNTTETQDATLIASTIFGDGTTVVSATITGAVGQSGTFTGGNTISPGTVPSDAGVIFSTGLISDYTNSTGTTDTNTAAGTSTGHGGAGDAQLDVIAGVATEDAVVFEATFIADHDFLTMQFTFSSEEYLEYVNGGVNDAVGVWVNDVFTPLTPSGQTVSIDTVNDVTNSNLYVDNPADTDPYNTEMDGFTITLSFKAPVDIGEENTIKIGLADGGDDAFDSNLLIAAQSVQTVALAFTDTFQVVQNDTAVIDVRENDFDDAGLGLTVTQINGVDVVAGDTVTLNTGEIVTLNADGTLTVEADNDLGTNAFTYQVTDANGVTDIGYVHLETIDAPAPDGYVDGSASADVIEVGYLGDPNGDLVDANDSLGLEGTSGDGDVIRAYGGDDTVNAGAGDDIVYGGVGNDTIAGGEGDDTLNGEDGDDTFIVGETTDNDTIDGGSSDEVTGDTLDASAVTSDITVDWTGFEDGTLDYNGTTVSFDDIETVLLGSGDDVVLQSGQSQLVDFDGGAGDDTFYGTSGEENFAGGSGNDVFILSNDFDEDVLTGGEAGETTGDVLDASAVTDNLTLDLSGPEAGILSDGIDAASFTEIEQIVLGSGDDGATGSNVADTIDLGAGADTVEAGEGDDAIALGSNALGAPDGDADVVVFSDGDGNDVITEMDAPTSNGDGTFTGIDTIDVSNLTSDGGTTPVNTTDVTVTDDGSGNAVLTFPGGESLTLVGIDPTQAADPFYLVALGIPSDGIVSGTAGNDNIGQFYDGDPDGDLVDSNDAILPGEVGNDDIIEAGAGNDIVSAGDGNDDVYGGAGDDILNGQAGNDFVSGGAGDDTITFDEQGDDTIVGGEADEVSGGDLLTGGSQTEDTTVIATGDEAGTYAVAGGGTATFSQIEQIHTGSGNDTIDLADDTAGIEVWSGDGQDTITGGSGDDTFLGQGGNDTIDGGAGNDSLDGDSGDDIISGGIGNDTLVGDIGEDRLDGGVGNDNLFGGEDDDILIGGEGADGLYGGDDADTIFAGIGDTVVGGEGGNDFDTLDLTGAGPARVIFDETDDEAGTVEFLDGSGNVTGTLAFSEIENVNFVPCFTKGTKIRTIRGEVSAERLRVGDRVVTRDHGLQPVRWIGTRTLTCDALDRQPELRPVRIAADALGQADPSRDTMVSPNHRMLMAGHSIEMNFGEDEVLVAAKHLVGMPGVEYVSGIDVTYVHIMFDTHEVICGDGTWSESFQPGDQSIAGLDTDQRTELFQIMPELRTQKTPDAYTSARVSLRRFEARLLHLC